MEIIQKQKKMIRQKLSQKQILNSPWNLFVKDPKSQRAKYIYWFAYSLGKVKNIAWGSFHIENKKLIIKDACSFNLVVLNKALGSWKANDFKLVATASKDNITDRISQHAFGIHKTQDNNRIDQYIKTNENINNLIKEFYDTIQYNTLAMKNQSEICNSDCPDKDNKPCHKDDKCKYMKYGTRNCKKKKDSYKTSNSKSMDDQYNELL